jgi:hypothetical protein
MIVREAATGQPLNGGMFAVSETEDFLATMIPRQVEAETALHNGDAAPRMAL